MKFEYDEDVFTKYIFSINPYWSLYYPHIEITVRKYGLSPTITWRYIDDKKVRWQPDDDDLASDQLRQYIDKYLKNLAFA